MSSWSEAISRSVMELLDRKLLVSQTVLPAIVILVFVASYTYSMKWIPVLWVARKTLLSYNSMSTGISGEPGQYVVSDHVAEFIGRNIKVHPDAAQTFPYWSTDIVDTGDGTTGGWSKSGLNDESRRDCELIEPSCFPMRSLLPEESMARLLPPMSVSIWIIPGHLHPQVSDISLSRWMRPSSSRR